MNYTFVLHWGCAGAHTSRSLLQPCGVSGLAISWQSCSAAAALQEARGWDPVKGQIWVPTWGFSVASYCLWYFLNCFASVRVLPVDANILGEGEKREQSLCIGALAGVWLHFIEQDWEHAYLDQPDFCVWEGYFHKLQANWSNWYYIIFIGKNTLKIWKLDKCIL